ncbi:hypothetical protein RP20_CCG019197 [Aedes albopictus]|nr:hypothetical protein RP20_CCG019197 [Aedes albopictus]
MLKKREPVYQAIWADNTAFDEVLISPVMVQDHMPDKVLAALNKVRLPPMTATTAAPSSISSSSSNDNDNEGAPSETMTMLPPPFAA